MTQIESPQPRALSRFDCLLHELEIGHECAIGDFTLSHARAHVLPGHFHAEICTPTGESFHARISVELSPYENLLQDKVDLHIENMRTTTTYAELTYSFSSQS